MKSEIEFKKEVESLYNGDIEVISRFKGLSFPILVKDKYGVMQIKKASQILNYRPGILSALNKTEYFMNMLQEMYPDTVKLIKPLSEYNKKKEGMLFETKFGIVKMTPEALLSGCKPSVRSAIDRKAYMRQQLLYLYENKYDFIINSTNRHEGKVTLICPIHGEVLIDNDHIFNGCGCTICNNTMRKSDTLYVIKLTNADESFYKLGISYISLKTNTVRRFKDYEKLGYIVEVIFIKTFASYEECFEKELHLKQFIKNNLYQPKL